MFHNTLSLNDPFVRELACAALSPTLRSILVFDVQPEMLRSMAAIAAKMLKEVTGRDVAQVNLGVMESEDNLWGNLAFGQKAGSSSTNWQEGLLTGEPGSSDIRLVIISDLLRLNLPTARACVMMIGADVMHLERNGRHERWRPDIFWLAGCSRTEVGRASPHLLDRFALRLQGRTSKGADRAAEILDWINMQGSPDERGDALLSSSVIEKLRKGAEICPRMEPEAIARVVEFASRLGAYSPRREISLARLARAYARVVGDGEVRVHHVDCAAEMIGLEPMPDEGQSAKDPDVTPFPAPAAGVWEEASESIAPVSNRPASGDVTGLEDVYNSGPSMPLAESPLEGALTPYPEDEALVKREAASLRMPKAYKAHRAARGPIIGAERATSLEDLALISTLFEAAKFQPYRRKQWDSPPDYLLLSPADLRSYRRAPVPEQMLMLLLDYTCLREQEWQNLLLPTLSPYLSWSYVERASVCIIQVGALDAEYELQAQRLTARSMLDPSVEEALRWRAARATPLAHGLDLTRQALQHSLQHGRNVVKHVFLVVVTDGRGNVTLDASFIRSVTEPINFEGVRDALQLARRIQSIDGVQTVVVNPQPQHHADLPFTLAEELGAKIVSIRDIEEAEAAA